MEKTYFDWEDDFNILNNVVTDIYVNNVLRIEKAGFYKIIINRDDMERLVVKLCTNENIGTTLTKNINNFLNLKLTLKNISSYNCRLYNEIDIYDIQCINYDFNLIKNTIEYTLKSSKVEYKSTKEKQILKEWFGSCNKLNFYNGVTLEKTYKDTTTYKIGKYKLFEANNSAKSYTSNSFWIKLKDYKFKVSINDINDTKETYNKYTIEYRTSWGMIPNEGTRRDIAIFLSFIIGTKLVKLGESSFDSKYIIVEKQYITPSPMDKMLLYEHNFNFYNDDYRKDDTDSVINQIPKMLNRYFKYKDKFRLNEVLETLYIHSYLNFELINYVTYIEMFSNISQEEKKLKTVISKGKFNTVLKKLNTVKGIPIQIRDKFQNLNNIGITKKAKKLLSKYKIDYIKYKDAFSTRGKVVHGKYVEIKEMYEASQKAKELLTILTLKKLNYNGYIRNFINDNELISMKDFSILNL